MRQNPTNIPGISVHTGLRDPIVVSAAKPIEALPVAPPSVVLSPLGLRFPYGVPSLEVH